MVAGRDPGDRFVRDMGYSENDFLRILPTALRGYEFRLDGNKIVITGDAGFRLSMVLTALPDRRLGQMRIPRIQVEFSFSGVADRERKRFIAQFDQRYQRGGG